MRINFKSNPLPAYAALAIVLVIAVVSLVLLAGTLTSIKGTENLNMRAAELMTAQNAAEAAVEKVFAQMQYDFQSSGGPGGVSTKAGNGTYAAMIPSTSDNAYFGNFTFSDAQGHTGKTYVSQTGTWTNALPMGYTNAIARISPIYRITSNAKATHGYSGVTGTAQEDVVLALMPLSAFAIFYNGLLEFSTCASMTVNGPVHSNTNIDVGAGSGASLLFNQRVTATGTCYAPTNNGQSWTGWNTYNTNNWRTTFAGYTSSNYYSQVPTEQVNLNMTNPITFIQQPATNNASTSSGQQQLFNEAQIILIVSNQPSSTNTMVYLKVQAAPSAADVPGQDLSPNILTLTNPTPAMLSTDLPFLSLTNHFYDTRESSTDNVTQIDVGKYSQWLTNTANPIADNNVIPKYPAGGGNGYPTILYVADYRTTNSSYKEDAVRLTNGIAPPSNGGEGFSLGTPNPLYVLGNYNQTNPAYLGTTNTSSGTVPCALMSDALTILSTNWSDSNSLHSAFSSSASAWNAAAADTVNAAIITGIVPSTGITDTTFSGGVHNLPRLLEDWSGSTLTLNTSIINLFNSAIAKGVFVNPGTYYEPPTRQFSYDLNFNNPNKIPPGIPCALVALRINWVNPPANTVTYNVTP